MDQIGIKFRLSLARLFRARWDVIEALVVVLLVDEDLDDGMWSRTSDDYIGRNLWHWM